MATKNEKTALHPGFNPTNFGNNTRNYTGLDFSNGKRTVYHMARKGNGIEIVEDGIEDVDALIQSEKCNAGLENIIRLQTLRYGTIENAIKRNADKQFYGDVSKIPTSIAEQEAYVKDIQSDVDELCTKLGISKEELLKSTQDSLAKLLADKANAAAAAAEGDNK